MGFFKKVFGGKEKEKPIRQTPPPVKPVKAATPPPPPPAAPHANVPVAQMDTKALLRALGTGQRETREAAARRLQELHDRQAIRPLMSAYMNYGDAAVLEALATFATDVTGPASSEAFDLSVMGQRRARLRRPSRAILPRAIGPVGCPAVRARREAGCRIAEEAAPRDAGAARGLP